jgi:hypothetical protein
MSYFNSNIFVVTWAHPQVADGGDGLQIWAIAVNISNKQPRAPYK